MKKRNMSLEVLEKKKGTKFIERDHNVIKTEFICEIKEAKNRKNIQYKLF